MTTEAGNPTTQQKFASLEKELNDATMERGDNIHGLILATLSRNHVFLLGPGGTGKSYLIDLLRKQIVGATHFQMLMTRFSQPDEVFGPVKLTALKQDRYERNTSGKLPEADFAFIDEIWKANSSILNSLLKILNEREYENGTSVTKVPLQTMLSASNELPSGEELAALYDRFLIKFTVDRVYENTSFFNIMKRNLPAPTTTVTLEELEQAQEDVKDIPVSDEILEMLWQVRVNLEHEGIEPSDRRFQWAMDIMRANAYMAGRDIVTADDIEVLSNILWDRPDQMGPVRRTVMELANPYMRQAEEFKDQAWAVWKAIQQKEDGKERRNVASDEIPSLNLAVKGLEQLKDAMKGSGRDTDRIEQVISEVENIKDKIYKLAIEF